MDFPSRGGGGGVAVLLATTYNRNRGRVHVSYTNDRQVYHGFVFSVDFVQFWPGTNFVDGALED